MNEPILAFVLRRLSEARGNWADIARDSGVPYHTLTKIAQGVSPNPRIETVQRLVDYFRVDERAPRRLHPQAAAPAPQPATAP